MRESETDKNRSQQHMSNSNNETKQDMEKTQLSRGEKRKRKSVEATQMKKGGNAEANTHRHGHTIADREQRESICL